MPPDPLLRTPEHREAIAGSHRNVSAQFHLRLYVAGFGISPHPAFFVYAGFKVEGFLHKTLRLKKVVWPTGKQTVNNTLIVIACVIVVGIFIWLFDAVAGGLIQALFHLVNG